MIPARIKYRLSVKQFAVLFVCMLLLSKFISRQLPTSPSSRQLKEMRFESDQYPPDVILTRPYGESDNKIALILHFLGVLYMFYGIGSVCDDYFVPALEEMSERWQITEDVAGATFMAAGGSAPEFFTSLVAVNIAKSDIGFGTIVGSAVFNVLFVIGLCGVFAKVSRWFSKHWSDLQVRSLWLCAF